MIRLPLTATFFKEATLGGLLVLWAALTFSSALVEICFVFSLAMWLARKWKVRQSILPAWDRRLALPLAAFVALCVLSSFWSEFPDRSLRGTFKILQQVTLFLLVADTFRDRKDRCKFELIFLGTFALLLANGLYQYWMGKDLLRGFALQGSSAGPRVSSSFRAYGLFAAYLVSTLPYLWTLGLRFRNGDHQMKPWYVCFISSVVGLTELVLTRSRGAFLALFLGFTLVMSYRKKVLAILAVLACMAAACLIVPRSMIIHLDGENKEQSLVERYYLWDRAIQVIKAKPWGGTGINTYAAAHPKYDKTKNWRVRNYYAHNGYLQMAAETGLPSLFFFLAFLFFYFRGGLSCLKRLQDVQERGVHLGLLNGILNFLILAVVDTVLHNPQLVMTFWFLSGLLLAYQETVRETREKEPQKEWVPLSATPA